jgi:hypothetical protein
MAQSPTYRLFLRAMEERKPVACLYDDRPRALCPIVLGHSGGRERALVWQFAGEAERGRVPDWKCFYLAKVAKAQLVDAPWNAGPGPHGAAQSCVKEVDVDVNPNSPYRPKRRLSWQ